MKRLSLIVARILLFVGITSLLTDTAYGCQCYSPDVCEAFSRADSVFVGKLIKVLRTTRANRSILIAEFQVETAFKGRTKRIEKAEFYGGGCEPDFVVGKNFFVYKSKLPNLVTCDRTREIKDAQMDRNYANEVSKLKNHYAIGGRLIGFSPEELSNIKIEIVVNDHTKFISPDKAGYYRYHTQSPSTINVHISFPSARNLEMSVGGGLFPEVSTDVVDYPLQYVRNGCDFRTFTLKN